MSYKLVDRKIPAGVIPIKFHFIDDSTFGMLNLSCWKDEIDKIDYSNQKIIDHTQIKIHFPMFEYFYVKECSSKDGFTFKQLVEKIVKTGLQVGKYDVEANPEHYIGPASAEDFIGEYAITSSDKRSDINIKDYNVYISVQH